MSELPHDRAPSSPEDRDRLPPEVADLIGRLGELPSVFTALPDVLGAVGSKLGWDAAVLWLRDGPTGAFVARQVWVGDRVEAARLIAAVNVASIPPAGDVLKSVRSTAGAMWTKNPLAGPLVWEPSPTEGNLVSCVQAPIRAGGALLGVLELFGRQDGPPTESVLTVLGALALTIGHALLLEQATAGADKREALLLRAMDDAPLGLQIIGADGLVTYANPRVAEVLGREPTAIVGVPFRAQFADVKAADALVSRALAGEDVDGEDLRAVAGGSSRWLRVFVRHLSDGDRAAAAACFVHDVTAERVALEALAAAEATERSFVEGAAGIAFYSLAPDGRIQRWNVGAERLYGWSAKDVESMTSAALFTPEAAADGLPARILRAVLEEGRFAYEDWRIRKDGQRFWAECVFTLRRDPDGMPLEIQVVVRDASERRRAEGLRRRASALDAANLAVLEASKHRSSASQALADGLSRHLKTIALALESPGREVETLARAKQAVSDAMASTDRARESFVRELAELPHERSSLAVDRDPIDMVRLVVEKVDLFRQLAAERRVTLEIDVAPEVDRVRTRSGALRQILYNLLSNAIKFSRERARVRIRVVAEGARSFRVEVEDGGIGLRPEALDRLLRTGNAEPDSVVPGLTEGVGLAATRQLVAEMGGRFGGRSLVGTGSTFFVVLPREDVESTPENFPGLVSVPTHVQRALVFTNDAAVRAELSWTLAGAGYDVVRTADAGEALDMAREQLFDVVAVDMLRPGVGAFIEELRSEGASYAVPCIVGAVAVEGGPSACILASEVLVTPARADQIHAAFERMGVAQVRSRRVVVLEAADGAARSAAKAIELLGIRAAAEASADAALRTCTEERVAAVCVSLLMPGLDVFDFLRHLRKTPHAASLPILLLVPEAIGPADLDHVLESARHASEEGHARPAGIFKTAVARCTARARAAKKEA